jgi:hypothetical protein
MLSRYARMGASSRLRFYQYIPWLESEGINVTVSPLFSDEYVHNLQSNKKSPLEILKAFPRRIKAMLEKRNFDLLWIEKEALPWLPGWIEKTLLLSSVPYVLDYDDAVFHYYDKHRNFVIRAMLSSKHTSLIQGASMVIVGNAYLADFARQAGAQRVEILPTVIDLARYPSPLPIHAKADASPCVGWTGQRATASFLVPYAPLFERMSLDGVARFVAIGIDAEALGLPMTSIQWTEQSEIASISCFDIGIMPLIDGFFERGKCGYKLIQYMACGLPVVASPVGINCEIVEHGVNGFLAETSEQWEQALKTLLADVNLRKRMGQVGRLKVEQRYCLQVTAPSLSRLLLTYEKK